MNTFEAPVIEIVVFEAEDVITTSGDKGGIDLPDDEF